MQDQTILMNASWTGYNSSSNWFVSFTRPKAGTTDSSNVQRSLSASRQDMIFAYGLTMPGIGYDAQVTQHYDYQGRNVVELYAESSSWTNHLASLVNGAGNSTITPDPSGSGTTNAGEGLAGQFKSSIIFSLFAIYIALRIAL